MQRKGTSDGSRSSRDAGGPVESTRDRDGGSSTSGVNGRGGSSALWSTIALLVFAGLMVLVTSVYTTRQDQQPAQVTPQAGGGQGGAGVSTFSAVTRASTSSFGGARGFPGQQQQQQQPQPAAPVTALRRVAQQPPVAVPPPQQQQQQQQQPQPVIPQQAPVVQAAPAPPPAQEPTNPSSSTTTTTSSTSSASSGRCAGVDSPIHFLTYANRGSKDSKFCRGLHSVIQNRIDLTILNWGGEHTGGNTNKYRIVQKTIQDMNDCDYIVFTDAYDVVFVQGPDHFKKQLDAMPDLEFLFGSECGCWPQWSFPNGRDLCLNKYPQSPTPYRYANTGVWVARVWAAKRFLTRIMAELTNAKGVTDDQHITNTLLLKGETSLFTLDYHARLVQSFHAGAVDCQPHKDIQIQSGTVVNTRTHTQPSVLHFNGNSKNVLLSMEWGLWHTAPGTASNADAHPPRLSAAEVDAHPIKLGPVPGKREGITTTPFKDLCGSVTAFGPHPQHHNNKVKITTK